MGKLLTLAVVALLALIVGKGVCGFLSVNSPVGGEFLVVEAWMPADAYREAVNQFRQGRYRKIIATAMMKDDPRVIVDRREDFGKRQLISFGIPSDLVVTVASEQVHRDRTFHSAMAVKRWLQAQHLETGSLDVVTIGPHARRSRLLFEKALGDDFEVGVIAIADRGFDSSHWWQSSEGVRAVVDESIAYLYARFIFSPAS